MFIFLIRLLFLVDTRNLIIGDSHVRLLGERFQFSDTDIFGFGGMTTGQLRHEHMGECENTTESLFLLVATTCTITCVLGVHLYRNSGWNVAGYVVKKLPSHLIFQNP